MMSVFHVLANIAVASAEMLWSMLWALILGFILSGIIMTFVPKKRIVRALGGAGPKEIGLAILLGAASSSCSYAAASMMKSLFQKGAGIIAALAFLLASTNLVLELSLVIWVMLGWQFVVAESFGGVLVVLFMATLMKLVGPVKDFERTRQSVGENHHQGCHADSGEDETFDPRTLRGWKQAARATAMEWKMLWKDIALGVVISGTLMTIVPQSWWKHLFLQNVPRGSILKLIENAFVGPLVSVLSFVCSVGNIPLAGVLYHSGIGFGGTISFIFSDLIIIPLLLIYRKYFGWRLAAWIFGIFYLSMAAAGVVVELLFQWCGWVPQTAAPHEMTSHGSWHQGSTLWLNLLFMVAALVVPWLAKSETRHVGHHGRHHSHS